MGKGKASYMLLFLFTGGGSGFIGKYLRNIAEKRGYEIVNISRKPKSSKELSWVSEECVSLCNVMEERVGIKEMWIK